MKNKFLILFAFVILLPCSLIFSACGENAEPKSLSIQLNKVGYTLSDNTITTEWGKKVEFTASDFTVKLIFSDDSQEIVSEKTEEKDGFTFASTLPTEAQLVDGKTPIGDYTLTFSYQELASYTITVKVVKANINVSNVVLVQNEFVYDTTAKYVAIKQDTVPTMVTAQIINGGTATNAGNYIAQIQFTLTDTEHYNAVANINRHWIIKKANVDVRYVALQQNEFTYDGTIKNIAINQDTVPSTVTAQIINQTSAINANSYSAFIAFTLLDPDNYNVIANITRPWVIKKANVDVSNVALIQNEFAYDGNEKTVAIDPNTVPNTVTAQIVDGGSAIEINNYNAIIAFRLTDTANYNPVNNISRPWAIIKANIDVSNVALTQDEFTYDGNEKIITINSNTVPNVVTAQIINSNTKTNAGTYQAVVAFTLLDTVHYNPVSDITLDWTINKADIDVSGVALTQNEFTYDGTTKFVTLNANTIPNTVTAQIISGNSGINANEYSAVIYFTLVDANNYNAVSNINRAWIINKADIDVSGVALTQNEFTYDGTTKFVTLNANTIPNTVTAQIISGNSGINANEYSAVIYFTLVDANNYNAISNINRAWTINKADIDTSGVQLVDDEFDYTGLEQSVAIDNTTLPVGIASAEIISGASATNAGDYTATIQFTLTDSDNYNSAENITLDWTINKVALTVSLPNKNVVCGNPATSVYTYSISSLTYVTVTGLVNNEKKADVLKGEFIYDFGGYDKDDCEPEQEYTVSFSGLYADNYEIECVDSTMTTLKAYWEVTSAGTTTYKNSLGSSISATANVETTYKLLDDFSMTWLTIGGTFNSNMILIFDLNGHTLSSTVASTQNNFVKLYRNKANNVTFKNGTITVGNCNSVFNILGTNELTLNSDLIINCEGDAITIFENGATLNTSATINAQGNYGIVGNGTESNYGTIINVTGGSITSSSTAIYHPQVGVLNISGGTISANDAAVEVRAGTVNITGGTFTSTASTFTKTPNGNGTTMSGVALAISQHTTDQDINVSIANATFNGEYALYEEDLQNDTARDKIAITITSGTFNGGVYSQNCDLSGWINS